MTGLYVLLLALALLCFVADAARSAAQRAQVLLALGLACWVVVPLIQTIRSTR